MIFGKNKIIANLKKDVERLTKNLNEATSKINESADVIKNLGNLCGKRQIEITSQKKIISNQDKKINDLLNQLKFKESQIFEAEERISKIEESLKIQRAAKGGLTKENNKLKKELKEMNQKNKELELLLKKSMPDRYSVKKLPSTVPKKKQAIRIKRSSVGSAANAILRQKNERESEHV